MFHIPAGLSSIDIGIYILNTPYVNLNEPIALKETVPFFYCI